MILFLLSDFVVILVLRSVRLLLLQHPKQALYQMHATTPAASTDITSTLSGTSPEGRGWGAKKQIDIGPTAFSARRCCCGSLGFAIASSMSSSYQFARSVYPPSQQFIPR
jgi:hypothetical protein